MSQVIFHVGLPKSGSSFLQQALFPNLPGVFYVPGTVTGWHQAVCGLIHDDSDAALDRARVAIAETEARSGGRPVLFSAEGLWLARRLPEVVSGAKYILILRNQADILESTYKQYIHGFGCVTPDEFLPHRDGVFVGRTSWPTPRDTDLASLDYRPIAERIVTAAGRDNLLILPMERLRRDRQGFIVDVCGFVGSAIPDRVPTAPVNRGYSRHSMAVARRLNRFVISVYHDRGFIPDQPFFRFFLARRERSRFARLMAGITRRISLRWVLQEVVDRLYYVPARVFDDETRARILDACAERNRALDATYGLNLREHGYYK